MTTKAINIFQGIFAVAGLILALVVTLSLGILFIAGWMDLLGFIDLDALF